MTLFGVKAVQDLLDGPVSSLTPTRLILVNYWLYPNQVFQFVRGRLFLTGRNGSGKSTALTAAITLLLDGDSSPSRLDPFGGTLRQLRYYLLGGPDAGFEASARRAYLALEFRTPAGGYETIGLGLSASEGSGAVGKWGFWLPGRVQQGGLALVEQGQPLSERILKERVRSLQGEVASGQGEYAALVRRRLYGVPEREFQEMIDLLLTVRGSKLGRDVRPSKITEVLRRSLPPIAPQVTQKLAEGIERLDRHAQRLTLLDAQEQAVRGVAEANFTLVLGRARRAHGRLRMAQSRDEQANRDLEEAQSERDRLTATVTGLREQGQTTSRDLEGIRIDLDATELQIGGQEQALKTTERRLVEVRTLLDQNRRRSRSVHDRSLRDQAHLQQAHAARQHALDQQNNLQASLHRLSWWVPEKAGRTLDGRAQALGVAEAALRTFERDTGRLTDRQATATAAAELAEAARVTLAQQTDLLDRTHRETAAFLSQQAAVLPFPPNALTAYRDELEAGSEMDEAFEHLASHAEVLILGAQEAQSAARDHVRDLTAQQLQLQDRQAALQQEVGAAPPLPLSRDLALQALKDQGIQARPFHQLVRPRADASDVGALEGALLASGLLTALVVPQEAQGTTLKILTSQGLADGLLTPGEAVEEHLGTVLEPEDGAPQSVQAILRSLAITLAAPAPVAITRQGWRSGLLAGGNPDEGVRFLGEKARQQERQKQLSALQKELSRVNAALAAGQETLTAATQALTDLDRVLRDLQAAPAVARDRRQAQRARDEALQRLMLRSETHESALQAWKEAQGAVKAAEQQLHGAFRPLGLQAVAGPETLQAAQREYHWARETLSAFLQAQDEGRRLDEVIAARSDELQERQQDLHELEAERLTLEAQRDALATQVTALRAQHDALDTAKLRSQVQALRGQLRELERRDRDLLRETTEAEERLRNVAGRLPALNTAADEAKLHLAQAAEHLAQVCSAHPALAPEAAPGLSVPTTEDALQHAEHHLWATFDLARPLLETPESYHPARTLAGPRFHIQGVLATPDHLLAHLTAELEGVRRLLSDEEARVFHDELIRELVEELDQKQRLATAWIDRLRTTLRGLSFHSEQLDVRTRVAPPPGEPVAQLAALIDTRIDPTHQPATWWQAVRDEVRRLIQALQARTGADVSFAQALERALDYREWTQFTFFSVTLDRRREITDRTFAQRSGGERSAMLYTFLFAALAARFDQCGPRTPRLLGLDEAFAGMDLTNIGVLYRIMEALNLSWIATSQHRIDLSADLSGAATYQLLRVSTPQGDSLGTLASIWDGAQAHDGQQSALA
ncbi:SbcC/MukB-like Walker B domain-containing protein [Deinococcus multiflagellatus]|nr:SbcC/MukB-like Walker B domain-containing protein [Deinococcus multiflagellatus]MBZ9715977.1 hypothetical protein [Deinococcus multiflagellatus]